MSFSLDNLVINESMDTSRLSSVDEMVTESFFIETLNYIKEANNEFRFTKQNLYKALLESNGDNQIINESFSDFFAKVLSIIKRFLEFIKSIFNKFSVAINKVIKSDKYLVKNKKVFDDFNEDKHGFAMECFTFTFDPLVPILNAQLEFDKEFKDMYNINTKDLDTLLDALSQIQVAFINKLQNGWYDKFRAMVITADYPISSGDFSNALFAVYRDGQSSTTNEQINVDDIKSSYNRFASYDNFMKSIKDNKNNIDKEYSTIQKSVTSMSGKCKSLDYSDFVRSFINRTYEGSTVAMTPELNAKIELFLKAKCDQVIEMSNIHALAFSAKLDAAKACYIQDKSLLYKALYRIKGSIPKEGK